MDSQVHILPDDWLSKILQRPVFRVLLTDEALEQTGFLQKIEKMRDYGSVFAYTKISPVAQRQIHFLEEFGFRLVDTNVLFGKTITSISPILQGEIEVHFAKPEDESGVVTLARNGFQFSRFHLDARFSTDEAGNIKAEWVRNFFKKKRGDAMVVALIDGIVAGFNQLLVSSDGILTIDLIAVDDKFRRRGIAGAMIDFAQNNISQCTQYTVGTQLANTPSMRLYENMGFRSIGASYVFHFHG